LNNADVFIYVGGESDVWLEGILASIDNPNLHIIRLTDLVQTLEEEELEGMQVEEESELESELESDPERDEHVWTSVVNAKAIVTSMTDSFSQWDSKNASTYQQNSANYLQELDALDNSFKETVANGQRKTIVFGDRFPFRYLAEEYGLECYAAFSGCSTAVDTNPQTIKFLIDKVNELDIPVVFYIELSSHRVADAVAQAIGAQELELHSCHNISKQDFDNGVTYLELMNRNVEQLKVALN
jgi:zinc transport system substrate-binding protein